MQACKPCKACSSIWRVYCEPVLKIGQIILLDACKNVANTSQSQCRFCSVYSKFIKGNVMPTVMSARFKISYLLVLFALVSGCGGGSSSSGQDNTGAGAGGDPAVGGAGGGAGAGDGNDDNNGTVQDVMTMAAPLSPVIRSGFGAGVTGTPVDAIQYFGGADTDSDLPNNWEPLLAGSADRAGGYFEIQYQGGDTTQRYARLSPDPENVDNQTLQFWLHDENLNAGNDDYRDMRGRIQANFYENFNLDTYYQSVRVRFGADFAALMDHAGTFDWLTIFEAWNGANWVADEAFPYHVAVNLTKPVGAAGSRLHFKAHGRSYVQGVGFNEIWSDSNEDFAVPLEQWMTLELYMREGDDQTGRFYMTVTPEDGEKMVLFDIVDYTQHPDDPAPAGFDYINPVKLYTLEPVLDIVNATGGSMDVHWDDLEFGHTAN